jgi:hypothetical protein
MHPVMSDSTLFILESEARQAREAARRVAMTNAPVSVSPIRSGLARLARALWQAADPRGYALAQARVRPGAATTTGDAPPVSPPGWTPGSGEWPDTFAYSPAGIAAGQRTNGIHPVTATIATTLESAPVRVNPLAVNGPSRELASGGEAPIEIREAETSERIPA